MVAQLVGTQLWLVWPLRMCSKQVSFSKIFNGFEGIVKIFLSCGGEQGKKN